MKDIEGIFVKQGGEFIAPPVLIQEKRLEIKAFIFDWDGVFNSGRKGESSTSDFTEGDAMGTNMLRLSFFLKHGFNPKMFIATGAHNPTAIRLATREHYDGVLFKVLNKVEILSFLKKKFQLEPRHCAFIYDDILDLSLAAETGLRFFVKKSSNPLLNRYVIQQGLCEYVSGNTGDANAVREICELIIGLNDNYEETIGERVKFTGAYSSYLENRHSVETAYYRKEQDELVEFQP